MRLHPYFVTAIGIIAAMPAFAGQTQAAPTPPEPPAVAVTPPVDTVTIPAGTKVLLSLKSAINTKTAQKGDGVYMISTFPVIQDSRVTIPVGVYVQGVVDRVVRPGRVKGRAQLDLHFTTMIFPNGKVIEIPGVLNSLPGSDGPKVKGSEGTVEQAGSKGKDAATIAKGAEIGAETGTIAGAVSGDPLKGLGYGSLAGAAAGAIYTLFTRGNDISIPSGSSVEMVLQRPLIVQPAQLAADGSGPQMTPANQPQPMAKPKQKMLCPYGSLGCN